MLVTLPDGSKFDFNAHIFTAVKPDFNSCGYTLYFLKKHFDNVQSVPVASVLLENHWHAYSLVDAIKSYFRSGRQAVKFAYDSKRRVVAV